jgi:hypothetical protein
VAQALLLLTFPNAKQGIAASLLFVSFGCTPASLAVQGASLGHFALLPNTALPAPSEPTTSAPSVEPVSNNISQGAAPAVTVAAAPSAVPVVPPASSSSGAGGGSAPAGAPPPTGRLFGVSGQGDVPLAGGQVLTRDGRQAATDASGFFTLPGGIPADGTLIAGKTGYLTSAVVGLGAGDFPSLHLQPAPGEDSASQPTAFSARPFLVTGVVLDDQGTPAAGVQVALQDAHGGFALPVPSDADGSFTLNVYAVNQTVTNGNLLAVGGSGVPFMALRTGVAVTPVANVLPPLSLTHSTHPIHVAIDQTAAPAAASVVLTIESPSGQSLSLTDPLGDFLVASLPGVKFGVRADAGDVATRTHSTLVQDDLQLAAGNGVTTVNAKMMAAPVAPTVSGNLVQWAPVTGAAGYTITMVDPIRHLQLWEAFTSDALFGLTGLKPAAGAYDLTLAAHDETGLSVRSVMSLLPRALRVLPLQSTSRSSLRVVTATF